MTPADEGLIPDPVPKSPQNKSYRSKTAGRRRFVFRLSLGLLGLMLLASGTGALLAHQASSIRSNLENAVDLVPKLRGELENGDFLAAEITLQTIQAQTSAARSTSTAPLWQSASYIPGFGKNFSAVREAAVSADDIAVRAAGPLLDKYELLNWQTLSPADGRFDIEGLQDAAPSISTAAQTVKLSYQRMASIDLSPLLPAVARPLGAATEQLEILTDVLDAVSSTAQLLPAVLGAEGPRNYLVLIQNSSEARATGGIPGALAVLHTDNGHIRLGEQNSAAALGAFRPMIDVDPEQVSLYTGRLGTQMQNVNLTPDFPTAAQTAKQMWERRYPLQTIDGVLALDTVVLSHLLDATGPLELTDPEVLERIRVTDLPLSLTKDNVVPTLLSEVYENIDDPEAQDAYFAAVASRVFSAFTDGKGDPARIPKALGTSIKENRLFLWSSHSEEQGIIGSTTVHGSVSGPDGEGTAFGAYFNDGTGAKMDYYVNRSVQLIQACPQGDYGQYTVRIAVMNNAPADAATVLPAYVTGNGVYGVEPGRVRTNYVVYGPSQAFVEAATVDGHATSVNTGEHGQRPVGTVSLELSPGQKATIDIVFSGVVQDSAPQLRVTPTIQPLDEVILPMERGECG